MRIKGDKIFNIVLYSIGMGIGGNILYNIYNGEENVKNRKKNE